LGYGFKVSIIMNEECLVGNRQLSNAAIDGAANGDSLPPQVEENAGGICPIVRLKYQ
jgi:hypothetical protein